MVGQTLLILSTEIEGHRIWAWTRGRTADIRFTSAGLTEVPAKAGMQSFVSKLDKRELVDPVVDWTDAGLTMVASYRLPRFFVSKRLTRLFNKIVDTFNAVYERDLRLIHDPVLGRLAWKTDLKCFTGICALGDLPAVTVELCERDGEAISQAVQRARELVEKWDQWAVRLNTCIVSELLSLYNDEWRADGPPLHADAFFARLALSSVTVEKDDSLFVRFETDMFAGHGVTASIAADDAVTIILE